MKGALERLSRAIEADLGTFSAGALPLLDEARWHVGALEPGPAGIQLAPRQREERTAKLIRTLERLEDLLEALQLAAHDGSREGRGPGEKK